MNILNITESLFIDKVPQGMTHLYPIRSPTRQDSRMLAESDQTINLQMDHLTLGVEVYCFPIRGQNDPVGILTDNYLRHPLSPVLFSVHILQEVSEFQ